MVKNSTNINKIKHSLVQIVKCFFSQTVISPIHHSLVQIVLPNTDKQNDEIRKPWTAYYKTVCKMFYPNRFSPILQVHIHIPWYRLQNVFLQTVISPIHHSLVHIVKCFSSKQLFHQYTIPWYRLSCTTLINKTNFEIRNPRTSYDKQLIESLMLKVKPNSS